MAENNNQAQKPRDAGSWTREKQSLTSKTELTQEEILKRRRDFYSKMLGMPKTSLKFCLKAGAATAGVLTVANAIGKTAAPEENIFKSLWSAFVETYQVLGSIGSFLIHHPFLTGFAVALYFAAGEMKKKIDRQMR